MIAKKGKAMRMHIPDTKFFVATALLFTVAGQSMAAEFDATLQWAKRVELGVPVSGVIQAVYADVGQKVAKGDKLLQLDDAFFKVAVKQASSNLKSEEEQYKEAERELDRSQQLYDRTVLSDHELQVAKNNKVKAEAERDHAQAMLVKAKQTLKYSTLRAPFNALVLERHAQVGKVNAATLQPETLFIVVDADQMLARLYVSEAQLSLFKLGNAATVVVGGDRVAGTTKAIGFEPVSTGSEASHYPVDVEFNTADKVLRAGQHVKVEIP
jgi:RND family efflux transporter MFP subunit